MLGKSLVVGALALQTATALQSACAKNEEVAVDDDGADNANDVFEGDESHIFWEFHVNEDVDMSTGAELFMLYPTDINTDAGDWASGIKTNYVQMQLLRNKIIEVHPELATVELKADADGTTAPFPAEDGYLAGFTLGWWAHDPKTRQRELNNWLKRVQSARLLDYAHKEWVELRVGGIFSTGEGAGVDSKESAIGDGWEEVNVNVDVDQKQQEAKTPSSPFSPAKSSASASNTGNAANANKKKVAIKSKPLPALPNSAASSRTMNTPPRKANPNQPPKTPPKPKELTGTSQVEQNILKQIRNY